MCLNLHLGSSKGQLITSENDKLQEDHLAHTLLIQLIRHACFPGTHRNRSLVGELLVALDWVA